MEPRNNITKLHEANIPAKLTEFTCGCWGQLKYAYSGGDYDLTNKRVSGGNESFEVLKFRQTARRDRLLFSDALVGALAEQRAADADVLEERRLALRECLKKLGPRDRVLIEHRYGGAETIKQIAKRLGRPANTLYKAFERIRRTLFECINKTVSAKW